MNRGKMWWGLALICIGLLLLLDTTGVVGFGEFVRTYWPILLVLWGISALRRRPRYGEEGVRSGSQAFGDSTTREEGDFVNSSNVFGNVVVAAVSQAFKGGTVSTVFGDTEVDLSGMSPAEGENTLTISGVFGRARVMVPDGVPLMVSANTKFGSLQCDGQRREGMGPTLHYTSDGYASAPRKLVIQASQVFGDISIERVHGRH